MITRVLKFGKRQNSQNQREGRKKSSEKMTQPDLAGTED